MKKRWVAVFDFDGTCIPKSYGSLYDVVDSNGGATKECHRLAEEMRKYYLSKLKVRELTQKEKEKWLSDTVDLYIRSKLTLLKIEEVLAKVKLRNGVLECLEILKEKNVPIAIISYGITQFIKTALRINGVTELVTDVYAADLKVDLNGLVVGFDLGSAVFPGKSKGKFSKLFADKHGAPYENILAVGDSSGDANLGHLKENRFGIAKDSNEAERLAEYMGTVAVTEDFMPVQNWIFQKMQEE